MRTHIAAVTLTLALTPAAFAADAFIPYEPVPTVPMVEAYDWSGAYIGLNAGGAFGKFKHPENFIESVESRSMVDPNLIGGLDITAGGFVGGAQIGYSWQSGQMIYGVEADIQATTLKAEVNNLYHVPGLKAGTKVPWYGTVRARLGYTPVDRFMIYATGGLAYGSVKSYTGYPDGTSDTSSKTKTGWTIGGGVEYAITRNWTVKSEYLYTDFGKSTIFHEDFGTVKNDVAFHTVRVGFNYKF